MRSIPEMIAALTFFGAFVVCPLVYMLMRHQRSLAELIHGRGSFEALQRIEALEREVRELRSEQNRKIIGADDRRELP